MSSSIAPKDPGVYTDIVWAGMPIVGYTLPCALLFLVVTGAVPAIDR